MSLTSEQVAGILQECAEGALLLDEADRDTVAALHLKAEQGFALSADETDRLEQIYAELSKRQIGQP